MTMRFKHAESSGYTPSGKQKKKKKKKAVWLHTEMLFLKFVNIQGI